MALQSGHQCAQKNISTALPRSEASVGGLLPRYSAIEYAGAGLPSSVSRFRFFWSRARIDVFL